MKKIIIIVVALLVLGGGGAGAYLFLGAKDEPVVGEDGEVIAEEAEAEEELEPIYLSLDPAFVVNYELNGSIRYLQLKLQTMAYDQGVIDKVSANMPAVRNALILLLSAQDYQSLSSIDGKENLRQQVLASINEVVRLKGKSQVDEVYFTSFVMQ